MALCFYQIRQKVVWKMVPGLVDTITRTKTKTTIPNTKNKSLLFFRAVYHSKNHVILHHVIVAILDAILNIYMLKTTTCQSNSPNTTHVENYQKIVINCDLDFRLILAFKMAAILDTILNISTF